MAAALAQGFTQFSLWTRYTSVDVSKVWQNGIKSSPKPTMSQRDCLKYYSPLSLRSSNSLAFSGRSVSSFSHDPSSIGLAPYIEYGLLEYKLMNLFDEALPLS